MTETNVNPVDAGQENVVDSQVTNESEVTTNPQETSVNNSEVANPKPVQTPEENARFAEVRRRAEKEARDAVIAELYGHYGITTYEQYQEALAAQEAQEEAERIGIDPTLYQELNSLKSELNSLRQEKEENALKNDPVKGELYKKWETDVKALAQKAQVPLAVAFSAILERRLPEVLGQKPDIESIKQQAIKEYIEKLKTGQKPVEGSGSGPVVVSETPKTFEDAKKGALQMLRAMKNAN